MNAGTGWLVQYVKKRQKINEREREVRYLYDLLGCVEG